MPFKVYFESTQIAIGKGPETKATISCKKPEVVTQQIGAFSASLDLQRSTGALEADFEVIVHQGLRR